MNGSSAPGRLSGNKRWERQQLAIIVNQLATPGLGSWMAGHRLAGGGQLIFACVGFLLLSLYLVRLVTDAWSAATQGVPPVTRPNSDWQRPLLLFGIAWLWSGVTSVQIALRIRRERRACAAASMDNDRTPPSLLPPRLGS